MELQLNHISFKYPNSTHYILDDVSLVFSQCWNSIVGFNGCGKTTLLKIIAKEITDYEGNQSKDLIAYYCQQSTEYKPKNIDDFFFTYSKKAFKIRDLLKIDESFYYQWENLSLGVRKRVQIACALFDEADVLCVDEPTNHLDSYNKELIIKALKEFSQIGIIVSHDREVLDTLCSTTYFLDEDKLFGTNYSQAEKELVKIHKNQDREYEKQSSEKKKLEKKIKDLKEENRQSKKRFSKSKIDSKDRDAKEKINLAKLTGKDKNDGQLLRRVHSQKELIDKNNSQSARVIKELGISFLSSDISRDLIIEKQEIKSDFLTIDVPRLVFTKGDRVLISGENGIGKTSLIKELLKMNSLKTLYIPQEIPQKNSLEILKEIKKENNAKKGQILTNFSRLSSKSENILDSHSPSLGELKKLLLAKGALEEHSLIILDEPTNHLDLKAINELENALLQYEGIIIFISHDKHFASKIKTIELTLGIKKNKITVIELE